MVDALVSQIWFILLFSLIVTLLTFPLVVVTSFFYDYLEKRHKNAPKILLMLIATFAGVLIALIITEFYLGNTLAQVFSAS